MLLDTTQTMKIRIVLVLMVAVLCNACSSELEAPTSLLTQVLKFYEGLERSELPAFAASANNIPNTSYVYFYPVEGATNFQYFQTRSIQNVPTNLENYNTVDLEVEDVFGGTLKRFVRVERQDAYCIVTYQANGVFYMSLPILLKNQQLGTTYRDVVSIDQTTPLKPSFEWATFGNNLAYFQVFTDLEEKFLSGTFTTVNAYQYGSTDNVISSLNTNLPPALVSGQDYNFTMFAIDADFWSANIVEKTFTVD